MVLLEVFESKTPCGSLHKINVYVGVFIASQESFLAFVWFNVSGIDLKPVIKGPKTAFHRSYPDLVL